MQWRSHLFFEGNKILNLYLRRLIEKNIKDLSTRNIEKIPNVFHNDVYGKSEIHPEQVNRSSTQVNKENNTEVKSPVIVTNPAIQKRFI
jgi:hypothetical protein